jgi:hypothetical protein
MAGIAGAGWLVVGVALFRAPAHPEAATARVVIISITVNLRRRIRSTFEPA